MGSLADAISRAVATDKPPEPTTPSFDGVAYTGVTRNSVDDYEAILGAFGHDVERYELDGAPTITRRELAAGGVTNTVRYRLREKRPPLDQALATAILEAPRHISDPGGPYWFNFQASDLQLGKVDNGGTAGIVDRYQASLARARHALDDSRNGAGIDGVHLIFAGDCIENLVSQGGRNSWRTDITTTEQTRLFRHLLYLTIDVLGHDVPKVYVDVVNGNHDDVTRAINTRPDDGWATESAMAVAEGLSKNPLGYGHVEVRVPPVDQGYMTVPVGDTNFTIAHGHQWKRAQGMRWWADQSYYKQSPLDAHILAHGHYHEFALENAGARTRICSPTFDGGSNYFREQYGAEARQGGLTYLTRAGEWSNLSLV